MDDCLQNNRKEYLEEQYSPSRWSKLHGPDTIIPDHLSKINHASQHARQTIRSEQNVYYGSQNNSPIRNGQLMDLFFPCKEKTFPENEESCILLFIHGGYWQELCKDNYSYIGEIFSKFGIITAVVGYDLAPHVKLETIYDEVKEAVIYLAKRFSSSPLFLSGHSAGGHLVSLLLKENWEDYGLPKSIIKGAIPISGIYNLEPLVCTYVNDALKMNTEEAVRLSPMQYIADMEKNANCTVLCLIGEYESPEFHRQSQEYCQALQGVGIEASLTVIPGTDHFSIMHDFSNDGYQGTKLIINMLERLYLKNPGNKSA